MHKEHGVCLDFDKEKLLGAFAGDCRIETRAVAYKRIKDAQEQDILADDLPFLKRYPYKDEQEFRVVFVDVNEHFEFFEYPLLLSWIRWITLSPWMSEGLAKSVRTALRSIDGCGRLPVSRSTLVNNEAWKTLTAGARA